MWNCANQLLKNHLLLWEERPGASFVLTTLKRSVSGLCYIYVTNLKKCGAV